ncbi:hypothetical protein [Streptomyces sp. XD-27]|uniref:hypothetical protein n=1 Tax=Streptomyces sp. XD-27 TaxID=3062779 RepID=UPI0026F46056|nr:hypothetical protein [Streptomyces sp. XD-27]WKX69614.1 hypothetical protein Q3Y56_06535 [Streptomyces sp. XD-27]
MSRRVSLPGADELFRTTGGMALQPSSPRRQANGEPRVPAPAGESDTTAVDPAEADATPAPPASGTAEHGGREPEHHEAAAATGERRGSAQDRPKNRQSQDGAATPGQSGQARRRGRAAARRPSGRERHDEKITVYVSAEELMDLEHARLVLRGEHGLAVDRGRIVREAVAVVLADLESRGDASILVRRLRGR